MREKRNWPLYLAVLTATVKCFSQKTFKTLLKEEWNNRIWQENISMTPTRY